MNRSATTPLLVSLIGVLAAPVALAQSAQDDQWHYVLEPYLMFPSIQGDIGVRNLPDAHVDVSPADLFSHLQFGAMLYAEAHNDSWALASDLLYSRVADNVTPNRLIDYGRVDQRYLLWEPAALFRVSPWFEVGAGLDLTALQTSLNLTVNRLLVPVTVSGSASTSKSWVDPTIIARATFPLSERWSVIARGNVGGFDVSSKFTWQAQLYFAYQIFKGQVFSVGYRAIGDDYVSGSGTTRFLYHVTLYGPEIRYAFLF